jgi:hypothetical protein
MVNFHTIESQTADRWGLPPCYLAGDGVDCTFNSDGATVLWHLNKRDKARLNKYYTPSPMV